ncbi:hypothetical protein C7967_101450 [Thalassospira sp. 11-3]|jgi:hypothetical protein|nr:hypothetical protein KO164_2789 [Thalassospira sp. KO164]PXX36060.1 hypothetical protein C7967_101450 [Thalassospira sp. 11-3]SEE53108.1 hypothetical protein SAMN04515623_2816 [Thalassospira permensis]
MLCLIIAIGVFSWRYIIQLISSSVPTCAGIKIAGSARAFLSDQAGKVYLPAGELYHHGSCNDFIVISEHVPVWFV